MSDDTPTGAHTEPPHCGGERATLLGYLESQRATLARKTQGLDAEQLRARIPGHPSTMTLGGLLKHLAFVEDYWFAYVVGGEKVEPWAGVDWSADADWDWNSACHDSPADLAALLDAAQHRSRRLADQEMQDLGATRPTRNGQANVSHRWILTHMVQEYARHNGHADLLRELIDGHVGE